MDITNKPLAAEGLISYRYKGSFGWIMIGAKDLKGAFSEASRSTHLRLQPERMEVWSETCQMYLPAVKPIYETGSDSSGFYAKVLPLDAYFKIVAYDADGDVRDTLSLWTSSKDAAIDYASQFSAGTALNPAGSASA